MRSPFPGTGWMVVLLVSRCASVPVPAAPPRLQFEIELRPPIAEGLADRSLVYLPVEYESDSRSWPLILFLHGDGERGESPELVKREGLPRLLDRLLHFPFVVVSPQCRRRRHWSPEALESLLDSIETRYRVDRSRVYATGLSSGAVAALRVAIRNPDRIAAVASIAPQKMPDGLCRLRNVAVWLFRSERDERIPPRISRRIARELTTCGAEVRLTIYAQEGHDAWSATYLREDLYDWFLAHRSAHARGESREEPGNPRTEQPPRPSRRTSVESQPLPRRMTLALSTLQLVTRRSDALSARVSR